MVTIADPLVAFSSCACLAAGRTLAFANPLAAKVARNVLKKSALAISTAFTPSVIVATKVPPTA